MQHRCFCQTGAVRNPDELNVIPVNHLERFVKLRIIGKSKTEFSQRMVRRVFICISFGVDITYCSRTFFTAIFTSPRISRRTHASSIFPTSTYPAIESAFFVDSCEALVIYFPQKKCAIMTKKLMQIYALWFFCPLNPLFHYSNSERRVGSSCGVVARRAKLEAN
jgi:hypothetical protein